MPHPQTTTALDVTTVDPADADEVLHLLVSEVTYAGRRLQMDADVAYPLPDGADERWLWPEALARVADDLRALDHAVAMLKDRRVDRRCVQALYVARRRDEQGMRPPGAAARLHELALGLADVPTVGGECVYCRRPATITTGEGVDRTSTCEPCLAYQRGRDDGRAAGVADMLVAAGHAARQLRDLTDEEALGSLQTGLEDPEDVYPSSGPRGEPIPGRTDPTPWLDALPVGSTVGLLRVMPSDEDVREWAAQRVADALDGLAPSADDDVADDRRRDALEQAVERAKAAA